MESISVADSPEPAETSQSDELTARFDQLCASLSQPQENLESICFELIQIWLRQGKDLCELRDRLKEETSNWPKSVASQIGYMLKSQMVYWLKVDRLQRSIHDFVSTLSRKENDPGIYHQLVKLGLEYRPQLHRYRRLLMVQEISAVRASEITTILEHDEAAQRFVAGNYSVRQAIAVARAHRARKPRSAPGKKNSHQALKLIRQAMLNLLKAADEQMKAGNSPWPLNVGPYVLTFIPPAQITPS